MIRGKRKQISLCENKAAAQRMLADKKAELKTRTKFGDTSFKSFLDRYMSWATANKAGETVRRDKISLDYLQEFRPIEEMSEITPAVLDEFKAWLKNRTEEKRKTIGKNKHVRGFLGPHGINRTLQSLKMIMRKAEAWEVVKPQNWKLVSRFKTPRGRVEFFTPEEITAMLERLRKTAAKLPADRRPPWETIILLGCRAGLRRGEIQNLMWRDIDFEKGILSVTPKKDWTPKDYECRDIPMSDDLKAHLLTLPHRGEYVIYDGYGDRLNIDSITTYIRAKVIDKTKIDGVKLKGNVHKLRHTFASHLVQAGVDLYTVSKLLGHSSIKTTEIYAHLSPVTLAGAVAKLPKV